MNTTSDPPVSTAIPMLTIRQLVPVKVIQISFSLVIIGSIATNVYVMFSFCITKQMHSVTHIFLMSMSVAQLVMGSVVAMFAMIQTLYPGSTSGLACEIPVHIELAIVASTIFSHLAVGLDRYYAVIYITKRLLNPARAAVVVTLIWTISVLYSLRLRLQFSKTREMDTTFCNLFVEEKEENFFFRVMDFSVLFLLPMIALSFMYGRMMHRLYTRHNLVNISVRRNLRVVNFLASSLVLFFLSWFPFYILDMVGDGMKLTLKPDLIYQVENNSTYIVLRFVFVLMALSNCFLTPLTYILYFPNIRAETRVAVLTVLGRPPGKHNSRQSRFISMLSTPMTPAISTPSTRQQTMPNMNNAVFRVLSADITRETAITIDSALSVIQEKSRKRDSSYSPESSSVSDKSEKPMDTTSQLTLNTNMSAYH